MIMPFDAARAALRSLARLRSRGYRALLLAAAERGGIHQVQPNRIIAEHTNWRFLNELKRELKT